MFAPDERTRDWREPGGRQDFEPLAVALDANYHEHHTIALDALEPDCA